MSKPRYYDPYDDPLYDRESELYGDYDGEDIDGFHTIDLFGPADEETDEETDYE